MRECLAENDLRTLMNIVGSGFEDDPTPGLPWAVLDGLRTLIGCDAIALCELDLPQRTTLILQAFDDTEPSLTLDFGDESDDPYWEVMRDFLPCSYHANGGDIARVVKWSDFYTLNELRQTRHWAEMCPDFAKYSMIMAMPTAPGRTRRILIWRDDGSDFGERERLLMQLLRPHLYEVYLDTQRRRQVIPKLSRRELEVLRARGARAQQRRHRAGAVRRRQHGPQAPGAHLRPHRCALAGGGGRIGVAAHQVTWTRDLRMAYSR